MNHPNLHPVAERSEQHERASKLLGGYTPFVPALLVAAFAKSSDYPALWNNARIKRIHVLRKEARLRTR